MSDANRYSHLLGSFSEAVKGHFYHSCSIPPSHSRIDKSDSLQHQVLRKLSLQQSSFAPTSYSSNTRTSVAAKNAPTGNLMFGKGCSAFFASVHEVTIFKSASNCARLNCEGDRPFFSIHWSESTAHISST